MQSAAAGKSGRIPGASCGDVAGRVGVHHRLQHPQFLDLLADAGKSSLRLLGISRRGFRSRCSQDGRRPGHPQGDALIAYLYEAAFIQQKIVIGFHEYLRLTRQTRQHKEQAIFTKAEVDAVREIDTVLSLLKASLEKIIALLGFSYGITNVTEQKTHAKKVAVLKKGLPSNVLSLYYWEWIEEFISPQNLDVLNNLRNGLMHKRGISNLQPHSYVGKSGENTPFDEIYQPLHEQHAKNSIVFLCTLALLTDQLVRLDPPSAEEQVQLCTFIQ